MKNRLFFLLSLWLLFGVSVQAGKRIVVNLSTQTATAYENGSVAFSGHISTGTAKRPTPTGRFRVLEKDIDHVSTSWPKPNGGAKMHYMLRVTNYGIAMHLGFVPNYPASHGCIRMQNGFAQRMYRWARVGTPIRIIGHAPARVYRSVAKKSIKKRIQKRPAVQKLTVLDALKTSDGKSKVYVPRNITSSRYVPRPLASESRRAPLDVMSGSRRAAKHVVNMPKREAYRKKQTVRRAPLDVMSSARRTTKRVASMPKRKIYRKQQTVRRAPLVALGISSKAPKRKTALRAKPKSVRSISTSAHKTSTLDALSSSPKVRERVNKAQKERWKNRPKRKSPRVNPLKALRA